MKEARTIDVGSCRVTLEIERRWIPWGGTLGGCVVLEGGPRAQKLARLEVLLHSMFQSSPPISSKRWDVREVGARERRVLPFTLTMGWGTSTFGSYGVVRAVIVKKSWFPWPRTTGISVDVVPPPEFVRAAAHLAELTDMTLGTWQVVGAGDGAAMRCATEDPDHPLRSAYLELYRGPDRDYGEIILEPRRGAPGAPKARRRIGIRFDRDDPEAILRAVRHCVEPVMTQSEALPIPSDLPEADPDTLPRPAEPFSSTRDLPRPADPDR